MNKIELTKQIKNDLGLKTDIEADKLLTIVFNTIVENAITDGECILPRIGKLKVVETAAQPERTGKTPQGIEYTTPAKPAGKKFKLQVLKDGKEALK